MSDKLSPMMAQWQECKDSACDAILLFRMGDFYEAFNEDAKKLSDCLGITLTSRQGYAMAGIPFHSLENSIEKLVNSYGKVAIAEQVSIPSKSFKGILQRAITSIVTPGTILNFKKTLSFDNCFVGAISKHGNMFFSSLIDSSICEMQCSKHTTLKDALDELHNLDIKELVSCEDFYKKNMNAIDDFCSFKNIRNKKVPSYWSNEQTCEDVLKKHFQLHTLDGFGFNNEKGFIHVCAISIRYLCEELHMKINHIKNIKVNHEFDFMPIDKATQIHLSLLPDSSKKNKSLFDTLNHAKTSMGKRALFQWIARPLINLEEIKQRQNLVLSLVNNQNSMFHLSTYLSKICDIERTLAKINLLTVLPKEIVSLKNSLVAIKSIISIIQCISGLNKIATKLNPLDDLVEKIERSLIEDPSNTVGDACIFKKGFNEKLDEVIEFSYKSKSWLTQYQEELRSSLNIRTLKVGFTSAFGYYIEVSKGLSKYVPESFVRVQTLTNCERFRSEKLSLFAEKINKTQEEILIIETSLLMQIRNDIASYSELIEQNSHAIAKLDCICSLAICAVKYNYCIPIVHDKNSEINIKDGRHPVLESMMSNHMFMPNNTNICDEKKLAIITGPNMGGKSTYIKQVALITLMSQIGSFVPAKSAVIGIVDRIFSRVGANDDIMNGKSTFMVEMAEMSNIINNATSKSLIIIDEIGRGTSTYDGIAIASAILQFLLTEKSKQAITLFTTHFFELTSICNHYKSAFNMHAVAHEDNGNVFFSHKIELGAAQKSFGIHVAKISGIPEKIIKRAETILDMLESKNVNKTSEVEINV